MISKKIKAIFLKVLPPVIVFSGILYLILNVNQLLVAKDNLEKSDIIVVPAGEPYIRVPHAVDLYHEGYAEKILFVNSKNSNTKSDYQIIKGQKLPIGNAYLNKAIAIDLGVSEKNIIILEGNAQNTLDEAIICQKYLSNNLEINSIILVTSKFHSGRSKIIFKEVFGNLNREIKIYSSPSKYDNSNTVQWWNNKKDLFWVIREFAALLLFYFRLLFVLH